MDIKELINEAIEARKFSYCPYSGFAVGAALLSKDGKVFKGCNIENASFGPTNCAERTAFFKAISEGVMEFDAIAVVGAKAGDIIDGFAYPCGVCRQVMEEFCEPKSFKVIVAKSVDEYREYNLVDLLPCGFGPKDLE
ncbi:MAG: cytidine deaminase [Lachnospiraceae bacterium]|nr:cytidine deaminase [Lachnospiraceae bacterium]